MTAPVQRVQYDIVDNPNAQLPMSSTKTISSAFESFREHLDEHYDRRERLIKVHHPGSGLYVDMHVFLPAGSR